MNLEDLIGRIADNGKIDDMEELSDILEDTMEVLKKYDENCYKKYEMKLYKMAYGNTFNREMAEKIVNKMRPYGMRWSLEETKRLQEQYGLNNIKSTDFFVVINSAYNDYRDLFNDDIEMYIKFTIDFIQDEDAKDGKVFNYFTMLANN